MRCVRIGKVLISRGKIWRKSVIRRLRFFEEIIMSFKLSVYDWSKN